MGIFDSLAKKTLGKIIDQVEDKIESATGVTLDLNNNSGRTAPVAQTAAQPAAQSSYSRAATGAYPTDAAQSAHFEDIFASSFPQFQIAKEVSPESLAIAAPAPCRPYSYALSSGGKTVALVMLTPHNRYQNRAFANAKASAEKAGIPFLNFFTHFRNETGYVVNRIQSAL